MLWYSKGEGGEGKKEEGEKEGKVVISIIANIVRILLSCPKSVHVDFNPEAMPHKP